MNWRKLYDENLTPEERISRQVLTQYSPAYARWLYDMRELHNKAQKGN